MPHAAQRWMSSVPSAIASQKKASSRSGIGGFTAGQSCALLGRGWLLDDARRAACRSRRRRSRARAGWRRCPGRRISGDPCTTARRLGEVEQEARPADVARHAGGWYFVTHPLSIISGSSNRSSTKSGVDDLARHAGGVERANQCSAVRDAERGLRRASNAVSAVEPRRRGPPPSAGALVVVDRRRRTASRRRSRRGGGTRATPAASRSSCGRSPRLPSASTPRDRRVEQVGVHDRWCRRTGPRRCGRGGRAPA